MTFDARWKFNLKTKEAKGQARQALFEAVNDVFKLDIKAEAKRGSPYLTGFNRNSIEVEVGQVPQGIKAVIYSQSGYGGYLELGTRFMKAVPYLYPAFNKFRARLGRLLGQKIAAIRPGLVRALQLKLFEPPPEK